MSKHIAWAGAAYDFAVDVDDPDNGGTRRLEYRSRPSDVMRVERINKKGFLASGAVPAYGDLLFVAYVAARRLQLTDERDFDAWAATVQDFGFVEREDEVDPGDPSRPDRGDAH